MKLLTGLGVLVLVLLGLAWLWRGRGGAKRSGASGASGASGPSGPSGLATPAVPPVLRAPTAAPPAHAHAAAASAAPSAERTAPPPLPEPTPPAALAEWRWVPRASLSEGRQRAIVAALQRVPQPSRALHQLIAPDFLAQASSSDLADLIQGEPQVAAKVLAAVNSPLFGLQAPVLSIGPAVTYLGLNTVRGICLRYMMEDAFQAGDAAVKRYFDQVWGASTLASELSLRLAQACHLPDPGALSTQVLLSFLGRLAMASLLPSPTLLALADQDLLTRCRREQTELGLCASEVGALLMQAWQLPEPLIQQVNAIDQLLSSPPPRPLSPASQRQALAYLGARLGERLMWGRVQPADAAQQVLGPDPDFFHLQQHWSGRALAGVPAWLASPDWQRSLAPMCQALQAGVR